MNPDPSLLQQQPSSCGSQLCPLDILENVQGAGGIENIPSLQSNTDAATMFATFWIEEISEPTKFLQLQYVQTVFLNFPVLGKNPVTNLTWPHVSVATLQKTFGGLVLTLTWFSFFGRYKYLELIVVDVVSVQKRGLKCNPGAKKTDHARKI
jgi:hypothetical protein